MKICGECKTEVPSATETCSKCGQGVRWTLKGRERTEEETESLTIALEDARANAKALVMRALEIGCVVHTCSAKPGKMCNTTPDNHGPPADMNPEKGPWYGVHHRRWLTWLREKKNSGNYSTPGGEFVPSGILTAAEQVYGCDVCDAPINVPCLHMRGPGLGKGEVRVVGQTLYPNGTRGVQAVVTDPAMIKMLEDGGRPVSVGYYPDEHRFPKTDLMARRTKQDSGVITSAPKQSRTAGFDQLYGKEIPDVPFTVETHRIPSREEYVRNGILGACDEILAAGADYEQVKRSVSKISNLLRPPPKFVSEGPSDVIFVESIDQETERFTNYLRQHDPKNPLLRHLRSVPMPDPDDTDTVVSRRHIHPGDCSSELPYDHAPGSPGCVATKKISGSLEWFKEQAKRALAVNPNITMLEFIERVGEPEYETEIQRAYHLTEIELAKALLNVGCDVRCGACAETFFTGSTDHAHHCAMLAKLKCFRCGKPALAKSQMCEEHERDEAEELEGHIQANRELNGSSGETRKFAIARMNELDQHPGMYGHTLEGLRGILITLLQVGGARPDAVTSFQEFFRVAVQRGDAAEPHPGNDPYGEVIAHARGILLGIQLLREGPQDAPSPLKLMLPKTPKPEA